MTSARKVGKLKHNSKSLEEWEGEAVIFVMHLSAAPTSTSRAALGQCNVSRISQCSHRSGSVCHRVLGRLPPALLSPGSVHLCPVFHQLFSWFPSLFWQSMFLSCSASLRKNVRRKEVCRNAEDLQMFIV